MDKDIYKYTIENIVAKCGGFREKSVIEGDYFVEKATWNNEHKVLNVLKEEPDADGYHDGFAVDIVTKSICG